VRRTGCCRAVSKKAEVSRTRETGCSLSGQLVALLFWACVLLVVTVLACDRGHYVNVVNDTHSDIFMYWDERGGNSIPAGTSQQVALLTGHPRVKETKKHLFEARDGEGRRVYRVELTEGELERQNWTIVVTKANAP